MKRQYKEQKEHLKRKLRTFTKERRKFNAKLKAKFKQRGSLKDSLKKLYLKKGVAVKKMKDAMLSVLKYVKQPALIKAEITKFFDGKVLMTATIKQVLQQPKILIDKVSEKFRQGRDSSNYEKQVVTKGQQAMKKLKKGTCSSGRW